MQHMIFIIAAFLLLLEVEGEGAASYYIEAFVVEIFRDSADGSLKVLID